jgi:hypothetical protein
MLPVRRGALSAVMRIRGSVSFDLTSRPFVDENDDAELPRVRDARAFAGNHLRRLPRPTAIQRRSGVDRHLRAQRGRCGGVVHDLFGAINPPPLYFSASLPDSPHER